VKRVFEKSFSHKLYQPTATAQQLQRNSYSATAAAPQCNSYSRATPQHRNAATPQRRNATMLQHYMFMNGTSMGKAMNACIINYALLGV